MNKKIYNEDLILNLIVNGDKVTPGNQKLLSELHQLDRATRELQLANAGLAMDLKKLSKDMTANAAEIKRKTKMFNENEKQIRMNQQAMDGLRQKIGIMGMTVSQLNKYLAVLRSQLMATTDPKIAAGLRKQIDEVNMRITTMTTGAGRMSQAWTKLARDANRYSAAIGWISIVIFGVSNAVGNLINRLTGLDRKLSEVMKTTGLTREEASRLKREFDRMPTPTKTDDLLDMAKIAGKLGIEGFDNIKRFTGAVDVLYTALGNDLNLSVEETAEKVGKLVNAFRVTDKMPIDEALLRTGSLLNQLDKSSVASAGTILEYMTRLSSLGTTANYPMEKLAGLAAALETVNIPAERGSTALRNIISGLGKYADKFSRILGIGIEDYKKMVETDINGVFMKLIELTSKGDKSIVDMMESMGDFEISGVRVAEVYGALAKNVDVIIKQQDIATESFKSSASVMSEYNIIINDFKGGIDLQSKRVRLLADEFNLRLRPAAFSVYKLWVDFLYLLRDMAGWLYDHSNLVKGIVSLYIVWKATAIAGFLKNIAVTIQYYTLVLIDNMKAHMAHNAILIGWQKNGIRGAIAALRALWATMLSNPMTAMITIAGALTGAFFLMKGKIDIVSKSISEFSTDMMKSREEMNKMFDIAEQTAIGTDKHRAAIQVLNELYGNKYLPNLLTEKDSIDAITKARRASIKALEDEILLKHQNETFAKIDEDFAEKQQDAATTLLRSFSGQKRGVAARDLDLMTQQLIDQVYSTEKRDPQEMANEWLKKWGESISTDDRIQARAMEKYLAIIQKRIDARAEIKSFTRGYGTGTNTSASTGTNPSGGIDTGTPRMSEEEFKLAQQGLETAYKQQVITLRNSNKDKEALRVAELQAEIAYMNQQIDLQNRYNKDDIAALTDLNYKKSELQQQLKEAGVKSNSEIEIIEVGHNMKLSTIKREYLEGKIQSEDEYNDRLLKEEIKFLGDKLAVLKEGSEEYMKVYNELLSKKIDAEKAIDVKIASARKQYSRIRTSGIVDEIDKSIAEENDRWEEEKKGLEEQLIVKQNLSQKEIEYNDIIYKIIEAKAKEHQEKMRKINELKDNPMLEGVSNALKGVTDIGNNTTFWDEAGLEEHFRQRNDLIREQYMIEKRMAGDNQKELQDAEKKYDDSLLKSKQDLFDAEKKMNEAKMQMAQAYISALIQIVGQESALGKALYIFNQGLSIAEVWIKAAAANAAITSQALAMFWWAPPLAAAAAAPAIAANNTSAAFNTGLIAAQTVGTIVQQWAEGKYPVIGNDDGKKYWADWTGDAKTGIYTKPSLIAEKGPELVVDYPTLRNIKMNAPGLIETIYSMRVPQYAKGAWGREQGAWSMGQVSSSNPSIPQPQFSDESLSRWENIVSRFEQMQWDFNFTEFEKIQNRRAIREKQSKL